MWRLCKEEVAHEAKQERWHGDNRHDEEEPHDFVVIEPEMKAAVHNLPSGGSKSALNPVDLTSSHGATATRRRRERTETASRWRCRERSASRGRWGVGGEAEARPSGLRHHVFPVATSHHWHELRRGTVSTSICFWACWPCAFPSSGMPPRDGSRNLPLRWPLFTKGRSHQMPRYYFHVRRGQMT